MRPGKWLTIRGLMIAVALIGLFLFANTGKYRPNFFDGVTQVLAMATLWVTVIVSVNRASRPRK